MQKKSLDIAMISANCVNVQRQFNTNIHQLLSTAVIMERVTQNAIRNFRTVHMQDVCVIQAGSEANAKRKQVIFA